MTLRISSCSLMMMTMMTTMMMTKMTTVMIVIVLKVMMVFGRCDVSDDDDNNFYGYGDVYSDCGDGVMMMMMVTLRIKFWMVMMMMMMMMMTVVEMTLTAIQWEWWLSLPQSLQCILRKKQFACVYIKKVFIGFNSLSDQHNIWRHSSDAVRVQGYEESKF